MTNLKTQIHEVAMTRPLIDMNTSFLLNIKSNLNKLLKEEIEGIDEMAKQMVRSAWKAEIESIEFELIKRN